MKSIKVNRKITSSSLEIEELKRFIGKNVEIIVREKTEEQNDDTKRKAAGMLEAFQDNTKRNEEKNAWKNGVKEKHGTR